jgi:hypothetical protein
MGAWLFWHRRPGPTETTAGKGDILLFPLPEGKVECPLFLKAIPL